MYAPGRGGEHAIRHLAGFSGTLQVDAYVAYKQLTDAKRVGGPLVLANCWGHFRREFYDIAKDANAPIAAEILRRIAALYAIEEESRGRSADDRQAVRQARTKPLVDALELWLKEQLARLSQGSTLARAIRYGLNHWQGLCRFLDDGRIELDSNTVEHSTRPIALSRKNALFAGSDEGAQNWAAIASLIETALYRARHKAVYAVRRTMPNGSRITHSYRSAVGHRGGIGPVPFGIVRLLTAPGGRRAGDRWDGSGSACRARMA